MACDTPVRVSLSFRRTTSFVALLIVLLVAYLSFPPTSTVPWAVGLVLFWPYITFILWAVVPAKYEQGRDALDFTFGAVFVGVFVTIFTVEFVGFLLAHVVLGAKLSEIREHLFILSEPLVWLSPQFLITPEASFMDVCGVMFANSFVIAIPLFLCVKVVKSALRRNQVTQIHIDGSVDHTDD